jgi:hypothetical protein
MPAATIEQSRRTCVRSSFISVAPVAEKMSLQDIITTAYWDRFLGRRQDLCQPQLLNHHLWNTKGKERQLRSEHMAKLFSTKQQTYFGSGKS